jgi:predicted PurR-regulated permease PerM
MGKMFGGIGLFVAAPLTVAMMVLLKMLYVEDAPGDESVDIPGEPGNDRKQTASPRAVPG